MSGKLKKYIYAKCLAHSPFHMDTHQMMGLWSHEYRYEDYGFRFIPEFSYWKLYSDCLAWAKEEKEGAEIKFLVAASINSTCCLSWLFCMAVFQLEDGKFMIFYVQKYTEVD